MTGAGFALFGIVVVLLLIPIAIFGGGALLFVGGRFIAKSPRATYWRSVGTYVLAGLAGGATSVAIRLIVPHTSGPMALAGGAIGSIGALVVVWLVIMGMFSVSFGKAILAWLPTLGMLVVTGPIMIAVLMPGLDKAREMARRAACGANLSAIGKGISLYSTAHKDQMPPDLEAIIKDGQNAGYFKCPSAKGNRQFDFFYMPAPASADPETIVACDYKDNHQDYRGILYMDLHVGHAMEAEFQAELAKPCNADFAKALREAESPERP